ncbi:hypothetical protein [Streptomyces rochei]|uniref:hypothetical protein n=1 Tax=Streptomyces rochei TaxID=1928 RepID=UPI0036607E90
MPDPFAVGITADGLLRAGAGIAGSTINGAMQRPKLTLIKLGSRDERREAYTNFLVACLALDHVLTVGAAGNFLAERGPEEVKDDIRRLTDMYKHPSFVAECALAEMMMVANEPVLKAANVLRDVLTNCVMVEAVKQVAISDSRRSQEYKLAGDAFREACMTYIAVCRKDLWYIPRWWQLHRQLGRLAVWAWKKVMRHGDLPVELEKALSAGALQQAGVRDKIGKYPDGRPRPSGVFPKQSSERLAASD